MLALPPARAYQELLKDLRFDYESFKDKGAYKHHYSNMISTGTAPSAKTIRLAQELADLSNALPCELTNSIFVRCDSQRMDVVKAIIMGSENTPYSGGAFLFDIYIEDSYPNNPPKMNLSTTGAGKIRFNPNLYSCGKVCLSLLGTWRGNASENWDPKHSTLLQVLISTQAIIMSEEVYFNEPGFEVEQGTEVGESKNEAYSNVVRYGNIKFAMIDNIRDPPKGFESVIKRHFFIRRESILTEVHRWLKWSKKRSATYVSLVYDHNSIWCNEFKKSATKYTEMLGEAIKELEQEFANLNPPARADLLSKTQSPRKKKQRVDKGVDQVVDLSTVDVSYGGQLDFKEMDLNDEKVKDRWSRYIGAMGLEAVTKQAKAHILLVGLGPLGVEIAKNIILSGCKKLTVFDDQITAPEDLAGQFFLSEEDIGRPRTVALQKLQ
jgi:ubiquitin-protein ligase